MAKIIIETIINAPIETCFNLCRDIDLHQVSTSKTRERAIAGRTSGLCESGDTITWEATHFGIKQQLTVKITKMDYPNYFEDIMLKGAFKSMKHRHYFLENSGNTLMKDIFEYETPLGFLGKLFDTIVLKHYMTAFLKERNSVIKQTAEKNNHL